MADQCKVIEERVTGDFRYCRKPLPCPRHSVVDLERADRNLHDAIGRCSVEDAIAAWEANGPTSLTVALMADALYGVREAKS